MRVKKTPLYDMHVKHGGKMVEFAGFMMPIQYMGIKSEHNSVRQNCGLFDVSHMGEVTITGENAAKSVQRFTTNDISDMKKGQVKYSPMCNKNGGVVDDLLVYKLDEDDYMLVINASNIDKDIKFIMENNIFDAKIVNVSDEISQIAIQGPKAVEVLEKLINDLPEKYYTFNNVLINNHSCIVSRTGYTGEDGFEIYCPNIAAQSIWKSLIEFGGENIMPCGLGCRDTLRFEASMPLYGHEMTEDISPIEAAIKFFVKIDKNNDFIGKDVIKKQIEQGISRRRCGLEILDRGIARQNAIIYHESKKVGFVTSGTKSLTLDKAYAMAIIDRPYNKRGTSLQIEVRGKMLESIVVKMPFYKRGNKD